MCAPGVLSVRVRRAQVGVEVQKADLPSALVGFEGQVFPCQPLGWALNPECNFEDTSDALDFGRMGAGKLVTPLSAQGIFLSVCSVTHS